MAVVLMSNLTNPGIEAETILRSTRRLWVPSNHPFHRAGKASFADIAAALLFRGLALVHDYFRESFVDPQSWLTSPRP